MAYNTLHQKNIVRTGFQPIPLFPRPNMQLIRFIKTRLIKPTAGHILDWMIDHVGLGNKIICKHETTLIKLIAIEFKISDQHHVMKLVRELVSLDIIRKETGQIYVFNPYIVNRMGLIPMHAFGFSAKKIKVLEAKGYTAWKKTDDAQKKLIPSARIRLQAAKFRAIKEATLPGEEDTDMVAIAELRDEVHDLKRDNQDIKDMLREVLCTLKKYDPEAVEDFKKRHLELVPSLTT